MAASINDVVVGVEDAASEKVLAQVLPDIFLGVEFRAIGREIKQADVLRHT